jgi:hypothetical protein
VDRIWSQLSTLAFLDGLSVVELVVSSSGNNAIPKFGCYDDGREAYALI